MYEYTHSLFSFMKLAALAGAYLISPTPGAANQNPSPEFARSFASYPNGTAYFDVWSPTFSTLYSQVGKCGSRCYNRKTS